MPIGSLKQFSLKFQRTFHWPIFEIAIGFLYVGSCAWQPQNVLRNYPASIFRILSITDLSPHCPEIMPQDISLNNLLKRGLRQTDYRSRDSLIAGFRRSWNGITMEIGEHSLTRIPTDCGRSSLRKATWLTATSKFGLYTSCVFSWHVICQWFCCVWFFVNFLSVRESPRHLLFSVGTQCDLRNLLVFVCK